MTSSEFLDALLTLPSMFAETPSPDAKHVAWTWRGVSSVRQVYAVPADGSTPPVRLSDDTENTYLVGWTPDSTAVIVQQDHGGDERYQLFKIELSQPGVMQPLTEVSPPFFLQVGELHPNMRWLFYGANYDFANNQPLEPTWIYRHDLTTGDRLALARPSKAGTYSPNLNLSGTHLLYNRRGNHPAGSHVWLVDVDGQGDREILNFGDELKVNASWLPDSERALFLAETGSYRRLGLWHRRDDSQRWLIDDPQRNIEAAWVPLGSLYAVVVEIENARSKVSFLDIESGAETFLPQIEGNLLPLAPTTDGMGDWLGSYYSARQPSSLVRFNPAKLSSTSDLREIASIWTMTNLKPADLSPAEDYRWQSVDGLSIQGWLYRAKTQPARGTIVYVHGGPTAHSADRFNAQIQFLVSQGFNVLDPNYRGSTGFGLTFQNSIKEDGWGGREQEDIRIGIERLIADGIAEAGKVGITGTSYGGYSSWCAITRYAPEIIAASAPICGMTDLVVDYETTRPDLRPYSEEMLGGRPDQVPEKYYERSPLHFVGDIKGKLLIVQGLQDPNVTPANVQAVKDALAKAAITYEVLEFEDEGHGISRTPNNRVLYQRLVEFFNFNA